MNCETVRPRLGEWIVGALESPEASMIESHVRDCRDCAAETEALHDLEERLAELPRVVEPPPPAHRWGMRAPLLAAAAGLVLTLGLALWKGLPSSIPLAAQDGVKEAESVRDGWMAVREEMARLAVADRPDGKALQAILADMHGRLARLRTRPEAAEAADRLARTRLAFELVLMGTADQRARFRSRFPAEEWKELEKIWRIPDPTPQQIVGTVDRMVERGAAEAAALVRRMGSITTGPEPIPLASWALDADDINPVIRTRAEDVLYRRAADWPEADLAKLADAAPKWHARIACVRSNPTADRPAEAETIVQVGNDGSVRVEGELLKEAWAELAGKLIHPAVAVYAHPDVAWEKVVMVLTRTMGPKRELACRLAVEGGPSVRRIFVWEQSRGGLKVSVTEDAIGYQRSEWKLGDGTCHPDLVAALRRIPGVAGAPFEFQAAPVVPAGKAIRVLAGVMAAGEGPWRIVAGK